MAIFLAITEVGNRWPALYPISYLVKTVVVGVMLVVLRKSYTPIRWKFWWLGVIVGVVGIVQWVGMQLWLQGHVNYFKPDPSVLPFDPTTAFGSPALSYA